MRAIALLPLLALLPAASAQEPARLLRFPDINRELVVFVYAGDLWRAPAAGGEARRLTTHEGVELFPKLSPDGKWIAFSAEYTGSRQVWVMPSGGGDPRQLTFYTDVGRMPPRGGWDYWVMSWTRDGKVLVRMNRTPWGERMGRYFLVDPQGGLETPLELPEGGSASLAADGRRIAYCPVDREFRTWKRTRGGRAQDVWLYDFEAKRSERLTDWAGTDNFPMWAGDTIYYTSDQGGRLNLQALDVNTHARRPVTSFTDDDVLWPSLGPDAIVFQKGGFLWRLDLASGQAAQLPITIGSELAWTVPHFKDVRRNVAAAAPSPSGARTVFEARGELFSVPAKDGPTRNLTATPGVRERAPAWSPDGKWLAYVSDASGEPELYVRPLDGAAAPRRVTEERGWIFTPSWSPDSKRLAFADHRQRLRVVEVESGALADVDRGARGDLTSFAWSPDSRWLAYEKELGRLTGVWAWSVEEKRPVALSDGKTNDHDPAFSADGRHLFFLSERDYRLTFSAFEFNFVYTRATRVLAAALDPAAPALFPPKNDEEKPAAKAEEKKPDEKKPDEKKDEKKEEKKDEKPATVIVPAGFPARVVGLPGLKAGGYGGLSAAAGAVFYVKSGEDDGESALWRYDLAERKEEKVLDGVSDYALTADGKKLLCRAGSDWLMVDAKANQKKDTKIDLGGLRVKLEPRAEWRQMFDDGWRIVRDWFYDEKLHGVDWAAERERYGALLPHVAHRSDLDFVLGEMISELEAGHTYVAQGDDPQVERVRGGMLGCELEADAASKRYRIAKVYEGENWDDAWRSPLTEPGVDVRAGHFLLAIDGEELTAKDNPYRLLEGKADRTVALLVAEKPEAAGARTVLVRPIGSESNLRYLDWIRGRLALCDKLSGGKVGYLHLPDTAVSGNRALQKHFYSQVDRPALVIDDRYNGGGFIPDRMIEYFGRRTLAWWARRGVESMTTPGFAHDGPKAMLINGYSSSGGDALPYFFKKLGLGTLVGTRTWGGLIGLSGQPSLVDGGAVQVPTFRIYDAEGKWVVENEGVAPDVEVVDVPEARIAGGDPSLEKAVELLLSELERRPPTRPTRPVPPVMVR